MGTGGARGLFCLLMLGWFWSMAMPAVAQTNAISHSPAKVVEKYFALDNKGVRLDATSFESVASLVEWKEEPAWGKVIVISGFTVPDDFRQWEIVNRLEVVVPVEFRVLGVMYLDTAGFVPEPGTEQVRVRVKVQGARWKIVEPLVPPHVGQKRMLNFVRQALLEETDSARQASLTVLQAALRKAKE
ncbi:MAG: hypothetical protein NBKEAIPA_00220 [Nitrospirae bacterium]|nr:MAG: hypothetical protein UZ03_NOB001002181 [Nitrospira sp. OLB3]MBV6468356.1 hypothetical protein [Nitrospirota bacterium]MCK6494272.1 hypothetical protein [Nitrospira sp.]MEB2339278.1 hypothetical protein [Nitrospirales bacterium]MCK6499266.1 hypothetical protein [Nitrospira sp.]